MSKKKKMKRRAGKTRQRHGGPVEMEIVLTEAGVEMLDDLREARLKLDDVDNDHLVEILGMALRSVDGDDGVALEHLTQEQIDALARMKSDDIETLIPPIERLRLLWSKGVLVENQESIPQKTMADFCLDRIVTALDIEATDDAMAKSRAQLWHLAETVRPETVSEIEDNARRQLTTTPDWAPEAGVGACGDGIIWGNPEPHSAWDIAMSGDDFREIAKKSPAMAMASAIMSGKAPEPRSSYSQRVISEEEMTVENYLKCLSASHAASKGRHQQAIKSIRDAGLINAYSGGGGAVSLDSTEIWVRLKEARLFHVPGEIYVNVYRACDVYTTTKIAGEDKWNPRSAGPPRDGFDGDEYIRRVVNAAELVRFPTRLPFSNCFIGYGYGAEIDPDRRATKFSFVENPEMFLSAKVVGHLICDDGSVYEFFNVIHSKLGKFTLTERYRDPGADKWRRTFELTPWILNVIIDVILDHKTFVLESPHSKTTKRDFRRNRKSYGFKEKGHLPPPYYLVKMSSELIIDRDRIRKSTNDGRREYSHRGDVCGHERMYVKRGTLPIDPIAEEKLLEREYEIVTDLEAIEPKLYDLLALRGKAFLKDGEYMAIRRVWIEDHIRPQDESLPYIPSLRVVDRNMETDDDE